MSDGSDALSSDLSSKMHVKERVARRASSRDDGQISRLSAEWRSETNTCAEFGVGGSLPWSDRGGSVFDSAEVGAFGLCLLALDHCLCGKCSTSGCNQPLTVDTALEKKRLRVQRKAQLCW